MIIGSDLGSTAMKYHPPGQPFTLENVMKIKEYNQKVRDTRDALRALGAKVKVRHRKLAHRNKTYLHIVAAGGHYACYHIVMPNIHKHFPDAYMTSGGFGPEMHITVALEK